jgi:hypothetical protein
MQIKQTKRNFTLPVQITEKSDIIYLKETMEQGYFTIVYTSRKKGSDYVG